jgi:hypothetical protein
MVSVLTSGVVERGFEQRSGQTKDFKIGICCFSTKHAYSLLNSLYEVWSKVFCKSNRTTSKLTALISYGNLISQSECIL